MLVGPGAGRGGAGGREEAGRERGCRPAWSRRTRPDWRWGTLDLPPKQAEALAVLCQAKSANPLTLADVCRLASCAPGPIQALRQKGLILAVKRRMDKADPSADGPAPAGPDAPPPPALTDEQVGVLDRLGPALESDAFATFLLHGVTGSGKTEVYLSAIERVVARGREAIVLVPEISLTPQTIRRFKRRFPKVAVLHSHLSDGERHRHWKSIAAGEVQVVVGARSAVFAPTRKLGLIVIDEEHEGTFKQETAPRYHARDVAVKRAQLMGVPVILGSATPALETWRNAEQGRYTRLALTKRVADRPMPEVALIDLRGEKPEPGQAIGALGVALRRAMAEALAAGGQVILLLNRRGFHTFILCPQCGHVRQVRRLRRRPDAPQGAPAGALPHLRRRARAPLGLPGLPVAEAPLRRDRHRTPGARGPRDAFPDRVVRRMDSDTMRTPGSHEKVLQAFKDGQVDILLGTQMIAKGLDFPAVTLVGVVNADTALHLPDFRAAERTFQLVAQVAGRTGRGDRPGRVLVQTFCPEHHAIQAAQHHDYLGFVAAELPMRQAAGVPPFGRVVRLIARGADDAAVAAYIQKVGHALAASAPPTVRLLGPAPAPVVKIRNLFRYHLQLRAPAARPLQDLLRAALPALGPPNGVELAVDVDPISLL